MEKNDDGVIVTAAEAKALYEVYLSGFVSGAVSMAVTNGVDEELAKRIASDMSDSLMASEITKVGIGALIRACLDDEDIDDTIGEVRNVNYRS